MNGLVLAQAAGDVNTDPITWESLLTAAGASVAALIIVQFIKIFKDMSDDATRKLAAVTGVILVLLAVFFVNDNPGAGEYGLGFLVGIQAGLAASKSVEIARNGLNHLVQSRG